nr:MAG TPA: hypothetical protein [Caudoviricetes sp.]
MPLSKHAKDIKSSGWNLCPQQKQVFYTDKLDLSRNSLK